MNIQNDVQSLQKISGGTEVAGTEKATGVQIAPGNLVAARDQAHLSTAANLVNASVAMSDVRTEKVAVIQAALADGSYQVKASDVADKLIDYMQSTHGSKQ
jgi:negative regulator of flagellin synthesis FlgM